MQKTVLIILSIMLGMLSLSAGTLSDIGYSLVFSELTVDDAPGDENSWVEFYNRSDSPLNAEGLILVCNNRIVYKFPKTTIPAKGFALVEFSKKKKEFKKYYDKAKLIKLWSKTQKEKVKTDYKKIFKQVRKETLGGLLTKEIKERSPGYCALFKNEISKKNLLDLVAWGHRGFTKFFDDKINKKHLFWANGKGIWLVHAKFLNMGHVSIGVDPGPGNAPWPFGKAVIARMNFLKKGYSNKCWQVVCQDLTEIGVGLVNQEITPGKANKWFIPSISNIGDVAPKKDIDVDIENSSLDYRIFTLNEKRVYRIQIAKDPYFEEIVFDEKKELPATLDKKLLKPGLYFIRMKADMKKCQTDWSPIRRFTYGLVKDDF